MDCSSLRTISSSCDVCADSSPVAAPPVRSAMAVFASAQTASACLMNDALVTCVELGPLTPLAPLAPVTGAELLSPQPASSTAATAAPSERYAHLPHTERIKVAGAPGPRWSENPRLCAVFHPSSRLPACGRLRARDSNPEFLLQRQACCHYTSPHQMRLRPGSPE